MERLRVCRFWSYELQPDDALEGLPGALDPRLGTGDKADNSHIIRDLSTGLYDITKRAFGLRSCST